MGEAARSAGASGVVGVVVTRTTLLVGTGGRRASRVSRAGSSATRPGPGAGPTRVPRIVRRRSAQGAATARSVTSASRARSDAAAISPATSAASSMSSGRAPDDLHVRRRARHDGPRHVSSSSSSSSSSSNVDGGARGTHPTRRPRTRRRPGAAPARRRPARPGPARSRARGPTCPAAGRRRSRGGTCRSRRRCGGASASPCSSSPQDMPVRSACRPRRSCSRSYSRAFRPPISDSSARMRGSSSASVDPNSARTPTAAST